MTYEELRQEISEAIDGTELKFKKLVVKEFGDAYSIGGEMCEVRLSLSSENPGGGKMAHVAGDTREEAFDKFSKLLQDLV